MFKHVIRSDYKLALLWVAMLTLGLIIYSLGLTGRFYFDDYGTLPALGANGGVDDWQAFLSFINGNQTGPTGRPISLMTFLINDNGWPGSAHTYKYTNMMFHTLNGTLIFWCAVLIKKAYEEKYKKTLHWAAPAVVAGIWLFNPMHASTVFYVVQRMTQVSAIFTLIGIITYIKGRILVNDNLAKGLVLMALGVVPFTVLAVYSKENGALLPLFVLVIDGAFFKNNNKTVFFFKQIFLVVPAILLVALVIYKGTVNGWFIDFPAREFSPFERLLVQPYIVLSYFKEFLLPELYTTGIYYDHVSISSIIDKPAAILFAVALLPAIITSCFFLNRFPLAVFPVLFFLTGHLIESTAIGLELVFEHRNYVPTAFIGFWVVAIVSRFSYKSSLVRFLPILITATYLVICGFRSELWGKPLDFALYTAMKSPDSGRAQIEAGNALVNAGLYNEALEHTESAIEKMPEYSALWMQAVLIDCMDGKVEPQRVEGFLLAESESRFDGRNYMALDKLWRHVVNGSCENLTPAVFKKLLDSYRNNGDPVGGAAGHRALSKYQAYWYIYFEDESSAINRYNYLSRDEQPESLMYKAAMLASDAQYGVAIRLAKKARDLVAAGELGYSSKSKNKFLKEIESFIILVKDDVAREK